MPTRKELKAKARKVIRRHYLLLVLLCAVSIFLGTEHSFIRSDAVNMYNMVSGHVTELGEVPLKINASTVREKVYNDLLNDNLKAGHDKAAAWIEKVREESVNGSILGRRRGIFAGIVNSISSGHLSVQIAEILHSLIHSRTITLALMVLASASFEIALWVFIKNMYKAILRRAVMEARTYHQVPVNHLLYFRLVGRWAKAAWTLLVAEVLEYLWWLTIVGGVIKHYAYYMVPYIVAENPDMKALDTITLSRRMMYGHKWECFVMELSFIGWRILGVITFGAADVLWTVPYQVAAFTEYYERLRQNAKEMTIEQAECLNDEYLFRRASIANLEHSYHDVLEQERYVESNRPQLTRLQRFFSENLGIWIGSTKDKLAYEDIESRKALIRGEEATLHGASYPQRLSPLWTDRSSIIIRRVNYLNSYTIWTVILVFFAFALVGWLWEVSIHLVEDGLFVNRGVMHGPWLPIYGGGVVMILCLLRRFRSRPVVEIIAIILVCGFVEYMTSLIMELSTGMRWWDYTGYFLNLNGRICAEGLLVFAIGGTAAVYLGVPALDAMISRLSSKVVIPLCLILLVCFGADMVYSHYVPNAGEGITDYTDYLTEE